MLAVSEGLDRSGSPLYLLTLLRRLLADGIECTVVSLEDGPLRHEFESAGIPVPVSYMSRPYAVAYDAVAYESKLSELTAWAAPQGFDIVHVNTIDAFFGTDLAVRLGIPAIWAIHESFTPEQWFAVNGWSPHPHVRKSMLNGFQTASTLLVAADEARTPLLAYGRPERLVTLPYGLDLQRIDKYRDGLDDLALRQQLGFSANDTVLLSLATIQPRKDQTVLAQAFAALADLHTETTLVLVGETGLDWTTRYVEGLREFVRRRGLSSRVKIVPVTEDHYEWLAIADVFVLASDIELLPLAVLEAMAFEVPVVATNVSGIPQVIHDGVTGFLCEPCDVSDLTRALARALALTPRERRHVGRRGAEVIRSGYDIGRYAAQYGSLVRALVADPGTLPVEALARDHGKQRERSAAFDD